MIQNTTIRKFVQNATKYKKKFFRDLAEAPKIILPNCKFYYKSWSFEVEYTGSDVECTSIRDYIDEVDKGWNTVCNYAVYPPGSTGLSNCYFQNNKDDYLKRYNMYYSPWRYDFFRNYRSN